MNVPLVLLNRRRRGGAAAFTPAGLFALAEPGVWYDPSDLTTLFQDTAGTTPVTTPGQTVALALDKSKGLVLGSELVTNGTFDTNLSGWTATNTVWSAGGAAITQVGVGIVLTQTIAIQSGKFYEIRGTCSSYTSGSLNVQTSVGTVIGISSVTGAGSFYALFTPGAGNTGIRFNATASGFVGTIDNISVKELPGFHATQATLASRPTYQVVSGRPCLVFDGVDDFMVTPTITPGIDKAQVFAGVRKLSDAAVGTIAEMSVTSDSNNGTFAAYTKSGFGNTGFGYFSKGTAFASAEVTSGYAAPVSVVMSGLGDISGDRSTLRLNGSQVAQITTDQGATNYLAYPMYIGRRGGTSTPFNGQIYSLIVRFGTNLDAGTITSTETWVNGKTGAY